MIPSFSFYNKMHIASIRIKQSGYFRYFDPHFSKFSDFFNLWCRKFSRSIKTVFRQSTSIPVFVFFIVLGNCRPVKIRKRIISFSVCAMTGVVIFRRSFTYKGQKNKIRDKHIFFFPFKPYSDSFISVCRGLDTHLQGFVSRCFRSFIVDGVNVSINISKVADSMRYWFHHANICRNTVYTK